MHVLSITFYVISMFNFLCCISYSLAAGFDHTVSGQSSGVLERTTLLARFSARRDAKKYTLDFVSMLSYTYTILSERDVNIAVYCSIYLKLQSNVVSCPYNTLEIFDSEEQLPISCYC